MAITVGIKTGPLYFLLLFLYVYSLAQLHACWGRFLLHVMTITGHLTTCSPTLSLFLFSISCSYFNKGSVCLLSTSLDVLGAVASVLVKTRGRGCWCWVMISHDACCSLPPPSAERKVSAAVILHWRRAGCRRPTQTGRRHLFTGSSKLQRWRKFTARELKLLQQLAHSFCSLSLCWTGVCQEKWMLFALYSRCSLKAHTENGGSLVRLRVRCSRVSGCTCPSIV